MLHPVEETGAGNDEAKAMLSALEQSEPEEQETGLDMETENEEE